jgi:hypothetical protein
MDYRTVAFEAEIGLDVFNAQTLQCGLFFRKFLTAEYPLSGPEILQEAGKTVRALISLYEFQVAHLDPEQNITAGIR